MKKILAVVLCLLLAVSAVACTVKPAATEAPAATAEPAPAEPEATEEPVVEEPVAEEPAAEETDIFAKGEGVMTYSDFIAAAVNDPVVVEGFVTLAAYNSEYGNISLYLQDQDGGYYVYRMPCTADDAAVLVPGAKVKVTGYKTEWSGEVEIDGSDASYELKEGSWIPEAIDVTDVFGTDDLIGHMNQLVSVKNVVIEASTDADGNEAAFLYNWDGSGAAGSNCDLYFNGSINGTPYSFTVETDECPEGSDIYTAITNLKVGDTIDLSGMLYWYEGPQLHVSGLISNLPDFSKLEDSMSFADFMAANDQEPVTVEGYIQQVAYNPEYANISMYLQDQDGGYYVYRMPCTEADAAVLIPGAKVQVKGFKTSWSGEVEVDGADATYQISGDSSWIADPVDITSLIDTDELITYMNEKVAVKGATILPSGENGDQAFLYNWDGSGAAGSNNDLYFNASVNGKDLSFTVETDECPEGSDVYTAVTQLEIGQIVDIEAFLYWYEGPQPHVYALTVVG